MCAQAAFCVAGKPAITARALHKAAKSGRWGSDAMRGNAEAHVQDLLGCAAHIGHDLSTLDPESGHTAHVRHASM